MKKLFLTFSISILAFSSSAQQDAHYSMWYACPSLLNPAAVTAMDEDYTVFTNYRSQWLRALDMPFRTNTVNAEMKIGNEKYRAGWFGSGVQFSNDATGETKILTNSVHIPVDYVFELSDDRLFSVGFKPGIINRSVKTNFQTWDNQWNGIAFDNTILPLEASASNYTRFDIGAGVFYKKTWHNRSKFDIGLSANHLTAPDAGYHVIIDQTYRQYLFHTSASIAMKKYRFLISPQIIAFFQGPTRDIIIGSSIDFLLKEGSTRTTFRQQQTFSVGLNYRMNDALIASFMLKMNGFQVGFAYDATLNINRVPTKTMGAIELFLKYSWLKGQKRRFIH